MKSDPIIKSFRQFKEETWADEPENECCVKEPANDISELDQLLRELFGQLNHYEEIYDRVSRLETLLNGESPVKGEPSGEECYDGKISSFRCMVKKFTGLNRNMAELTDSLYATIG